MSLPSRERGLKLVVNLEDIPQYQVAPFAGAWIEINSGFEKSSFGNVALFAGAWIEISTETALSLKLAGRSLYLAF